MKTARLPRNRPARIMTTVPGVSEARSFVGLAFLLLRNLPRTSSAG